MGTETGRPRHDVTASSGPTGQIGQLMREEVRVTFLMNVADLLGGVKVLRLGSKKALEGPLAAHELILRRLPMVSLVHLIDHLRSIGKEEALETVGMSVRTYQRRRDAPQKLLTSDLTGRIWEFAEILGKAKEVFGSQEDAEQWLERPATGLNQQRPIDLMKTIAGAQVVKQFLERVDYGVYT